LTLHIVDVRLTCLINITYLLTYLKGLHNPSNSKQKTKGDENITSLADNNNNNNNNNKPLQPLFNTMVGFHARGFVLVGKK